MYWVFLVYTEVLLGKPGMFGLWFRHYSHTTCITLGVISSLRDRVALFFTDLINHLARVIQTSQKYRYAKTFEIKNFV